MNKKIIAVLITLGFIFQINFSSCQNNNSYQLNVDEFQKKLALTSNAILIDVRTTGEYDGGHLSEAKNIDWNGNNFELEVQKLDKTKSFFVYCLAGSRSASAANKMRNLGFKNVYEMQGGIMAWNNAGKSLSLPKNATTANTMSLEEFNKKINSIDKEIVLVDFYAPWCGPCKKMAPMFEELEKEQTSKLNFIKINVDDNKELCKTLGIVDLPTTIIYKSGKEHWKKAGFLEKQEIIKALP
jgi:thioredoxin 1